ncbi:MAG: GNAT family N-acetyltransferase, partial [Actinomycetota bacterium]|nr:GNAT family N-acetyltransferase [Actinomycetota bacterium]
LEDVATLAAHRRRGLARAVCSAAVAAAVAAGSALVFVVAEDDDWPKELYGKLGFDSVGASWDITRDPA